MKLKEVNSEQEFTLTKDTCRPHPWRRYFARMMDQVIYSLLFTALFCKAFQKNPLLETVTGNQALFIIGICCMTLLLEPLQLALFGTTISKWIMGIRITEDGKNKLSYGRAVVRTFWVLFRGEAFCFPLLSLWRAIRSYVTYTRGEELPWEARAGSEISIRGDKLGFRIAGLCASGALCTVLFAGFLLASQLPPNRGMLTAEQFVENFNYYKKYYEEEDGWELLSDGTWQDHNGEDGVWYMQAADDFRERPVVTMEEEDGVLTKVAYAYIYSGTEISDGGWSDLVQCFRAFAWAQDSVKPWNGRLWASTAFLSENQYRSFSYSEGKLEVQCEAAIRGFHIAAGWLVPSDDETAGEYQVRLEMSL